MVTLRVIPLKFSDVYSLLESVGGNNTLAAYFVILSIKGKVYPKAGHEGPEKE